MSKKNLEKKLIDAMQREGDFPHWHNYPAPSNYKFNLPDDGTELDIAWPEFKIGVEINGGQWSSAKMGHNSGKGVHRDAVKNNWALLKGWKIVMLVTDHIDKEMVTYTIPYLRRLFRAEGVPLRDYAGMIQTWFIEDTVLEGWYPEGEQKDDTETD